MKKFIASFSVCPYSIYLVAMAMRTKVSIIGTSVKTPTIAAEHRDRHQSFKSIDAGLFISFLT